MKGFIHQGVVQSNGSVDTSQSINDPTQLKVLSSDGRCHLKNPKIGDFEWWYFDVIDPQGQVMLKIVAHLGTDPMRRKIYPQLAISAKTPPLSQAITLTYTLNDFQASTELCDVSLKDDFHVSVVSPNHDNIYQLSVDTKVFKANLKFIPDIEGWKPLGDEITIERKNKRSEFFWMIPLPKAKVVGAFSIGNSTFQLGDGVGYHDHNYWKVDSPKKLFMDDVISKWYWGKIVAKDYTIIFMDTDLKSRSIKSLFLAKGDQIIQSSNNFIKVIPAGFQKDIEVKTHYPSQITISSVEDNDLFEIILNGKEVIERKDLLEGVTPILKWLINVFVSSPAYYGILADATINIEHESIKGIGNYEMMFFRKT